MRNLTLSRVVGDSFLLPFATAALAAIIFVLDMISRREVAAAMLYVAVVLIAGRFFRSRGIALTAAGCGCLTLLAYASDRETLANATLSSAAIAVTALLVTRGQAAEGEARRGETEWREVFEHNPVMYFQIDATGTVLSVNGAGAAGLGYRADELVGQSVLKVLPDTERARVRGNLDLCLESLGQSNTWEVPKICKDGAKLWVRETAKAIRRSNGDVVMLIACEDVTERRRAEEAARESGRRFRALIEHAYDVVFLLDRDCSVLYASPSVERVLGYAPRDLVGSSAFDLVHPGQLEEARNRFAAAQDRPGGSFTTQRLIRHRHGTWVWTENTVTNLLGEPSVRAFVMNLRDVSARKQAEEGLRASEQRFRDYAETASDWFWESGPDHRFMSFSHQAPYGAAGIGATRWDLAADFEEEPDKWRAHRAILEAHEPFRDFTYRTVRPEGPTVWVSVSGRPVFDQEGRFLGYRGGATDVSERVSAEEALRQRDTKIRRLAEANIIGIYFWDAEGPILDANQEFLRIVGYDREDLVSGRLNWIEISPPEWRERVDHQLAALKRTRTVPPYEKEYIRKDGARVTVLIYDSSFDETAKHGVCFALDLTERKRAEEALRRSEAYLAEAQRLSHTGTSVYNAAGFLYWSEESYRIWGLDPMQGLPDRETVWRRIHPDDRNRVRRKTREGLFQSKEYAIEFRIVLPEETVKYVESTGHPLLSSEGTLIEIIATDVDVTQRVRAQEQAERLRQLESELAHMNRLSMMGELTAWLAHEILHPIATARNYARAATRFLGMKPPDLAEVGEALACIVRDADRAKDIVGRVRDHIKKAPPRKDRLEVNEAIKDVIVMARNAIDKNKVLVRTDFMANSIPVEGDRVQLQQVVLNLILNAIEAMSSDKEGARELLIKTEQSQTNGILVAVRDSGPGIDRELFERVFDAFYTTKTSGVGMGLAICRSIIDAHGGRLWADANEPRGAVFQFTLPAAQLDS